MRTKGSCLVRPQSGSSAPLFPGNTPGRTQLRNSKGRGSRSAAASVSPGDTFPGKRHRPEGPRLASRALQTQWQLDGRTMWENPRKMPEPAPTGTPPAPRGNLRAPAGLSPGLPGVNVSFPGGSPTPCYWGTLSLTHHGTFWTRTRLPLRAVSWGRLCLTPNGPTLSAGVVSRKRSAESENERDDWEDIGRVLLGGPGGVGVRVAGGGGAPRRRQRRVHSPQRWLFRGGRGGG